MKGGALVRPIRECKISCRGCFLGKPILRYPSVGAELPMLSECSRWIVFTQTKLSPPNQFIRLSFNELRHFPTPVVTVLTHLFRTSRLSCLASASPGGLKPPAAHLSQRRTQPATSSQLAPDAIRVATFPANLASERCDIQVRLDDWRGQRLDDYRLQLQFRWYRVRVILLTV